MPSVGTLIIGLGIFVLLAAAIAIFVAIESKNEKRQQAENRENHNAKKREEQEKRAREDCEKRNVSAEKSAIDLLG